MGAPSGDGHYIDQEDYQRWIGEVEAPRIRKYLERTGRAEFDANWPELAIVMPTYNTPPSYLHEALQSLRNQVYPRWRLWAVDDASDHPEVRQILDTYAAADERIEVVLRHHNSGISSATNAALDHVRAGFVGFMDHDDRLPPHALLTVATTLRNHPNVKILYSDSDELSPDGIRCNPYFKPHWNYEFFLGQNYLNHLTVYAVDLIRAVGGLQTAFDGSQDYDLALRALEQTTDEQILHVPEILYHWRQVATSVARSDLASAARRARLAVAGHLQRLGHSAEVTPAPGALIYNRVLWRQENRSNMATLVYGTDQSQTEQTCAALCSKAPDHTQCHPLLISTGDSLGAVLNRRIASLECDAVCLVPAGCAPGTEDWLSLVWTQLQRPGLGAVACKLVSRDGFIEGGPLRTGLSDPAGAGLFGPVFDGKPETAKGYFAQLLLDQQVDAADLAGLAFRRDSFDLVGGLDAGLNQPTLLGADFTLRLRQAGRKTLWTPFCIFRYQAVHPSAPPTGEEITRFRDRWAGLLGEASELNPNLAPTGRLS